MTEDSPGATHRRSGTIGESLDAQMSYEFEGTAHCNECDVPMIGNEDTPSDPAFECPECDQRLTFKIEITQPRWDS